MRGGRAFQTGRTEGTKALLGRRLELAEPMVAVQSNGRKNIGDDRYRAYHCRLHVLRKHNPQNA